MDRVVITGIHTSLHKSTV